MRLLTMTHGAPELAALRRGELLGGLELLTRLNSGLDRLSEPDLVVLREEVVATHVLQVEADEVLVVTVLAAGLHVLNGHFFAFIGAGVWTGKLFVRSISAVRPHRASH